MENSDCTGVWVKHQKVLQWFYLLTFLITDLLSYLLTYSLSYLKTYLFTYFLNFLLSSLMTDLDTCWLTYFLTYRLSYLLTYGLIYLLTSFFTYFLNLLLTYFLLTDLLMYFLTYLIIYLLFYLLSYLIIFLLTFLLTFVESPSFFSTRRFITAFTNALCEYFVTRYVLRGGVVSTSSSPEAVGPPLFGCPLLLIQCMRSYPPYWGPFSIRNLRTRHSVVTGIHLSRAVIVGLIII